MVLSKNFLSKGLPFLGIMIGGSFALSIATDNRYMIQRHKGVGLKEMSDLGIPMDSEIDLVKEYQDMKDNLDIDSWENVRGPRPWEEDSTKYQEIIDRRIKETAEKKKKTGSSWAG